MLHIQTQTIATTYCGSHNLIQCRGNIRNLFPFARQSSCFSQWQSFCSNAMWQPIIFFHADLLHPKNDQFMKFFSHSLEIDPYFEVGAYMFQFSNFACLCIDRNTFYAVKYEKCNTTKYQMQHTRES